MREFTEKLVEMSRRLELLDDGEKVMTFILGQQHLGAMMEVLELETAPRLMVGVTRHRLDYDLVLGYQAR